MVRLSICLSDNDDTEDLRASSWFKSEIPNFSDDQLEDEKYLCILVSNVLKKPKNLFAHLHRIYFCFRKNWSEQLYAALLDLLAILSGNGQDLAKSLVYGSRSVISVEQLAILRNYLHRPVHLKSASHAYAILTQGLLGTDELVSYKPDSIINQDYIKLANDFIEYSQLEESMTLLESGLTLYPERTDIQELLLELYQCSNQEERFLATYTSLIESSVLLMDKWQRLKLIFEAKHHEK